MKKYREPQYHVVPIPTVGYMGGTLEQWEVKDDSGEVVMVIRDRGLVKPVGKLIQILNRRLGPAVPEGGEQE